MNVVNALPPLLLLCCAQAVLAQAPSSQEAERAELAQAFGDQAVISLATGSRQPLRRAPAVATVITAADIAAMGADSLDEVLETVPGLHVSRITIVGRSLYAMRGIYSTGSVSPQVLVLQDGLPTTTAYTGDFGSLWNGIPLDNVARIEVVRGPGSALYGADAYAGVINIVSKNPDEMQGTRLAARAGSFDTASASLMHGGSWLGWDIGLYLRAGHTAGHQRIVTADAQTRLDGLFGTHASRAPGPADLGHDTVDARFEAARGRWKLQADFRRRWHQGSGYGVSSALDPTGQASVNRASTVLAWSDDRLRPDWGLDLQASTVYVSETLRGVLFPPGVRFPTGSFPAGVLAGPDRWERHWRVAASTVYRGFSGQQWRFGLGHEDLDLYRTRTYKNFLLNGAGVPVPLAPADERTETSDIQPHIRPYRRQLNYAYAQNEWSFARDWTLTAGLRHDRYDDFGHTTNPRLALVWDAALDLTLKLLHGRAFRAPAFAEMRGINPVANGNPALRPETIATTEAALVWQPAADMQFGMNLFRHRLRDVIQAVPNPAPAPGATYGNTGQQRGKGFELEAMWDPRRTLRLSAHYSYQHMTDTTLNANAGYAPRHDAYARADWRWGAGTLASLQVNHVAGRVRAAGDARPPVADYTSVDLTLRRDAARSGWSAMLTVRNLFNADIREPSLAPGVIPNDLPQAPRALYLELGYRY